MSDASLTGGLEGNSGNQGYTSDVKAVVSLAGAIGDTSWMSNNSTPIFSFHGDQDATVPFGTGQISLAVFDIMEVDGSESVHIKAEKLGIKNCFKAHYGADHVPHQSSAAYLDTTEQYISQFLLSEVCGEPEFCICNTPADPVACHPLDGTTSIQIEEMGDLLSIFPNPTKNKLSISLEGIKIENIILYDINGRKIFNQMPFATYTEINTSTLNQGVYFIKIEIDKGMLTKKLIVE